jgi:hypothetical protein
MASVTKATSKIVIAGLGIGLLYLLFVRSRTTKAPTSVNPKDVNALPSNLKNLFDELNAKGYSPLASPSSSKVKSIAFSIKDGENNVGVEVDEMDVVSFKESDFKPLFRTQYKNGEFTSNDKVVAESNDRLSGILQIIANKDYVL